MIKFVTRAYGYPFLFDLVLEVIYSLSMMQVETTSDVPTQLSLNVIESPDFLRECSLECGDLRVELREELS